MSHVFLFLNVQTLFKTKFIFLYLKLRNGKKQAFDWLKNPFAMCKQALAFWKHQ